MERAVSVSAADALVRRWSTQNTGMREYEVAARIAETALASGCF
jgi:hypothetical protein